MTNDSSSVSSDFNFKVKGMSKPKSSTLNFIRQFARTCVTIQGCALGTMMLNWSAGQHRSFKINTRTLMKKPKGPDHPSGPLFFSPDHITQDLFLSSFINAGECIFDSEICRQRRFGQFTVTSTCWLIIINFVIYLTNISYWISTFACICWFHFSFDCLIEPDVFCTYGWIVLSDNLL